MSRTTWIIVLIGAGVVLAILIGVLGKGGKSNSNSQASAQDNFCSSLTALKGSVNDLTSLDPSTASKSDYQSAVSSIQSDWDSFKTAASDSKNATTTQLNDDWNTFKSAVDNVPSDASVSDSLNDVSASAKTLASSVQSTLSGPDCSS